MLNESLVPDDPLIPSSTPESHGDGPNQPCGMCQGPFGFSIIAFMAGSVAAASTAGSFAPGIGSSSAGAGNRGPGAASSGFHGSEGATAGVAIVVAGGGNRVPGG